MGSLRNPNPWSPYDNYKDCSLGICSIYCPQFCYFIFPPPPPSDDDSTTPFSPLIIAIIGVLASAFLLVSYYTIVTRYCRRGNQIVETEEDNDEIPIGQWQVASTGLDEAMIKSITVCKYQKADRLIEGTECAVCLSEFQEDESLRLLPKCSHAFHIPCIDTWLKSQSNCPLCRAIVVPLAHPSPNPQAPPDVNTDSDEIQQPDELILVVNDQERHCVEQVVGDQHRHLVEQVVINLVGDDDQTPKNPIQDNPNAEDTETRIEQVVSDQDCVKQFRRSISLGTFRFQPQLLISDILKIEEIHEDLQLEKDQSLRGINSTSIRRSNSTGGLMFVEHEKGKNFLLPN